MIGSALYSLLDPLLNVASRAAEHFDDCVKRMQDRSLVLLRSGRRSSARFRALASLNYPSAWQFGVAFYVSSEYGLRLRTDWGLLSLSAHLDGYEVDDVTEFLLGLNESQGEDLCTEIEFGATECIDVVSLRWSVWKPRYHWDSSWPRWRSGHIYPLAIVLGDAVCTTTNLERRDVVIPMPEGAYSAVATRQHWIWERARWPRPWLERYCVDFDIAGGVPIGRKADDAVLGTSVVGTDFGTAISALVDRFMADRRRYAPSDTAPDQHPLCWQHKPRIRRHVPLWSTAGVIEVDAWDPFRGRWLPRFLSDREFEAAVQRGELDEHPCGCCGAEYGVPCRDAECPNNGLRCPVRSSDPHWAKACQGCSFCDSSQTSDATRGDA